MAAQGAADLDDDSLASTAELGLVQQLRDELANELKNLAVAECDFPHTTGDIFLTRVLRGNGKDVGQSAAWYRNFLEFRRANGLDEMFKTCRSKGLKWTANSMPEADTVRQYYNVHFDEERLRTAGGHLIWYDSVGDVDPRLLDHMDKLSSFIKGIAEMRSEAADRLSAKEGRLVKIVRIVDCDGVSPWSPPPEFRQYFRKVMFPLLIGSSIEISHRLFVINCAWFSVRMFNVFAPLMPERARRRSVPLDQAFLEHAELTTLVSGKVLTELTATRQTDGDDGATLSGAMRMISAGKSMDKSVQAAAGQNVAWSFALGTPGKGADGSPTRGLAGRALDAVGGEVTDVMFSVSLWPDPPDGDGGGGGADASATTEHVLCPPKQVVADQGTITGSVEVPTSGAVVLRWSNSHSWVRAKLVATYEITIS